MNFANSFAVSFCSWIAIVISGLVFFRNSPLRFWKEIVIVAAFASGLSVIIQYYNGIMLITFLPPLLAFLFFSVLSGLNWILSLTMIIVGVTISGLLEFSVSYAFSRCDINLTLNKLANDYTMESWCFVCLHLLLSFYLYKKRWGFTSMSKCQRPKLRDKFVIIILIISFINSIAGIVIAFRKTSILLYFALLVFVLLIAYTILHYRKELKEDL